MILKYDAEKEEYIYESFSEIFKDQVQQRKGSLLVEKGYC